MSTIAKRRLAFVLALTGLSLGFVLLDSQSAAVSEEATQSSPTPQRQVSRSAAAEFSRALLASAAAPSSKRDVLEPEVDEPEALELEEAQRRSLAVAHSAAERELSEARADFERSERFRLALDELGRVADEAELDGQHARARALRQRAAMLAAKAEAEGFELPS